MTGIIESFKKGIYFSVRNRHSLMMMSILAALSALLIISIKYGDLSEHDPIIGLYLSTSLVFMISFIFVFVSMIKISENILKLTKKE